MGVGTATEMSIRQKFSNHLCVALGEDYEILEEISVKDGKKRYQIDMLILDADKVEPIGDKHKWEKNAVKGIIETKGLNVKASTGIVQVLEYNRLIGSPLCISTNFKKIFSIMTEGLSPRLKEIEGCS